MSVVQPIKKQKQWRLQPGERRVILLAGDFLMSLLGLVAALIVWSRPDWLKFSLEFLQQRIPGWFYLLPLVWIILLVELYDVRRASRIRDTIVGISMAALGYLGLYLLIYFSSEPDSLPRLGVAVFIISTSLFTLLWRFIYIRVFTAPLFLRRVLIIGAGRAGRTMAKMVKEIRPQPFTLLGFIDDDTKKTGTDIEGCHVLGTSFDLLDLAKEHNVSDLILAISNDVGSATFDTLLQAEEKGIVITSMPLMYEELLGRVPIFLLKSDWILRSFLDKAHTSGFFEFWKRIIDLIGGLIGCIFTLLVLPFVSFLTLIDSGLPIFYSQTRLGKNSKVYKIFKFRTMKQDAEKDGKPKMASENDQRVTRIGKFLRKTHLDEFPQFINVLKGEMSLVGPRAERPELVEELEKVVPFYRARLLIKPGVTGWAQINFGYASNAEETAVKLEYDLYYIQHRNLLLDFSIMLRTFSTMIGFRGQ